MLSSKQSLVWFLDTSAALSIALGENRNAVAWYERCRAKGDRFAASKLLELEMTRVLRRESLDPEIALGFTRNLTLARVDDALINEAAAIRPHIRTLDALHLATAARIGSHATTVVTHDAAMARVADQLGFEVVDPVDPS